MDRDFLNKWAAEFMGDGVHTWKKVSDGWWCNDCGATQSHFGPEPLSIPDYCSDDSPRSLVDGLEAKIPGNKRAHYQHELASQITERQWIECDDREWMQITASAHQRVRAVHETMKDVHIGRSK